MKKLIEILHALCLALVALAACLQCCAPAYTVVAADRLPFTIYHLPILPNERNPDMIDWLKDLFSGLWAWAKPKLAALTNPEP